MPSAPSAACKSAVVAFGPRLLVALLILLFILATAGAFRSCARALPEIENCLSCASCSVSIFCSPITVVPFAVTVGCLTLGIAALVLLIVLLRLLISVSLCSLAALKLFDTLVGLPYCGIAAVTAAAPPAAVAAMSVIGDPVASA